MNFRLCFIKYIMFKGFKAMFVKILYSNSSQNVTIINKMLINSCFFND